MSKEEIFRVNNTNGDISIYRVDKIIHVEYFKKDNTIKILYEGNPNIIEIKYGLISEAEKFMDIIINNFNKKRTYITKRAHLSYR
jgi:hypothetical protein